MGTLFFSGIEKKATADVLVKLGAAGMMSQLLYSPNLLEACADIPLVLDSGAYTKELTRRDIEKYADLIIKLNDRCIWYANADCIGNQQKTNENYTFLLSLLPTELHSRILWIYQQSADLKYLYEGLEKHSRIGIGGLVPLLLSPDKTRARNIILNLASIVLKSGKFSHWFGVTSYEIIRTLNAYLPDYSVDSTTWLVGGRYGQLINARGQQNPASAGGYDFDTESILKQNVRTMQKWVIPPVVKTSGNLHVQMSFLDGVA